MMRNVTIIGILVLLCGIGASWLPARAQAQEVPAKPAADAPSKDVKPSADDLHALPMNRPEGEARHRRGGPDGAGHMPKTGGPADLDPGMPGPPDEEHWMDFGPGRGRPDFGPETIERMMNVVRDLDADRAASLEELRERDPKLFVQVLSRSGRHLLGLSLLKDRDSDLYDIKLAELRAGQQINRIAQQIRAARDTCSESELERLTTMLRERLREQSDFNFRARGRELILLESHLKTVREKLVEDITHRDDLIEQRMTDLLSPTDDDDQGDTFAAESVPAPAP